MGGGFCVGVSGSEGDGEEGVLYIVTHRPMVSHKTHGRTTSWAQE